MVLVTRCLLCFLIIVFCSGEADYLYANPMRVLKTITFASQNSVWVKNVRLFTDRVEEVSKGEIRFNYVGGPETIPPFEQIEAVKRGIVDVALLPAAYFVPQLPEADAMKLSPYLPWEERERGIEQFYAGLIAKRLGLFYAGKISGGIKYHFYLKKPVAGPDFKGLKIRVTPIYEPFVKALGGIPVTMAPGEVYIALERGVVDGFGWPSIGVSDLGWHEVVRYVIDPGFYQTDVCVLFNLRAWEKFDRKQKHLVEKAMREAERESWRLSRTMADRERETLREKGVRTIEFSEEGRARYLDLAYRSAWERVLQKSSREGSRLKTLLEHR